MAFDTLGINVTASGVAGVARQVGHLANSFAKYINTVERTDRASMRAATSTALLADALSGKAQRAVDSFARSIPAAQKQLTNLTNKIQVLQLRLASSANAQINYVNATKQLQAATAALGAQTASLPTLMAREADALLKVQSATLAVVAAQNKLDANTDPKAVGGLTANLNKKIRELDRLKIAYNNAKAAVIAYKAAEATFERAEKDWQRAARALATYKTQYNALTQAQKDGADVQKKLNQLIKDEADARAHAQDMSDNAADSMANLQETFEGTSEETGIFSRLLGDLVGKFAGTSNGAWGMVSAATKLVPQLAAIGVAMDVVAVAAKAAQLAFNLFVGALKIAWNVIKKTVEIVWNLAKAVGTTLWNAFKKIVSLPFALINKLFGGVGGSMQRVMEMAIGMNLSRVWWQLGMKIRDMAKMAATAATEYQVTFIRLRGLMLNETLGKMGISPTDSDYIEKYNLALKEATKSAEELVTWTSQLAVSTIFDAGAILDVYTLGMSYGFASESAKELTQAVLDFATGMGLGDTEMRRIIENFGQMRAQGKITGTELRDLARGSFVPVNDVLERLAKNAGLVGDYMVPNLQEINSVLSQMRENGELTETAFTAMSAQIQKLGADGKITRQEFETLATQFKDPAILQQFGLTAEQAGKALEGIKTGQLTKELNELIATGKLTIDEFFEAFIEMSEDRFPNAARSMGVSMKAVISNVQDYIKTMLGWRLIAPVFEVVAKHVQDFIQNSLMSPKQIATFDRMGKAFKNIAELAMTYSDALFRAQKFSEKFFGAGNIAKIWKFAGELTNILGSLGTEEFAKKFDIFSLAIKQIPLAGESRQLVLSGIQSLNKIMSDIMAGVEIDPEELGESLDDTFGVLWREYFKPSMTDWWDNTVTPAIKKKIGEVWGDIKTAFNEWKTDTLLPGMETFFTETLPGWFGNISTWISNNKVPILTSVTTFAQEVVDAFANVSGDELGEDHWLTILLKTLEGLAGYATLKIEDPTSEIAQDKLEEVTKLFERLKIALSIEIGDLTPVQNLVDGLSKPGAQSGMAQITRTFELIGDLLSMGRGSGKAGLSLFEAIGRLFEKGDAESGEAKISFLERLLAAMYGLAGIPIGIVDAVAALLDVIIRFIGNLKSADWNSVDNVSEFISTISASWTEAKDSSGAVEALGNWVDSMSNFVGTVNGLDVYGALDKAKTFADFIKTGFTTGEWEWPENLTTPELTITPTVTVVPYTGEGFTFDPSTGTMVWTGPSGALPPVEVEQPFVVKPIYTMGIVTPPIGTAGGEWAPFMPDLSTLWDVGKLFPSGQTTQTINIPAPDIKIDGDLNAKGGEQAGLFVEGFTEGITTGISDVEIQIPEITVGRRREGGEDPVAQFINDIVTQITSDTSVPAAGAALAGQLTEAFVAEYNGISVETFELVHNIQDILYNSSGTMYVTGSNMMQFLVNAITEKSADAETRITSLVTSLSTLVGGMSAKFQAAGSNAVLGLRMGMESQMNALLIWWAIQVEKLNNIVPDLNMQNSPSRLYRGYGEDMIKGMQLGIEHGAKDAENSMRKAATDIKQSTGVIAGAQVSNSYSNVSNTNNWNVRMTTPIIASTPLQAYEVLRMRAR